MIPNPRPSTELSDPREHVRSVTIELTDEQIRRADSVLRGFLEVKIPRRGARSEIYTLHIDFPTIDNADAFGRELAVLTGLFVYRVPEFRIPDAWEELPSKEFRVWCYQASAGCRLPEIRTTILRALAYCDPWVVDPDGKIVVENETMGWVGRNASITIIPPILAGVLCVDYWVKKNGFYALGPIFPELAKWRPGSGSPSSPASTPIDSRDSLPSRFNTFSLGTQKTPTQ